jgi:hypothetical protein
VDSKLLVEASKGLAKESKRDSSPMKAIAVLTVSFLPGTAVAVSLPFPLPHEIMLEMPRPLTIVL